MEFGTERTASSGGSWEPYWHVVGRMESGTERKASSGGSWEPYWRVVGRMESGSAICRVRPRDDCRGVRSPGVGPKGFGRLGSPGVGPKGKPGRSSGGRTGVWEESVSRRSPAAWSPRSSAVRKFGWRWEFGPEPGAGEFGS
ncbi:hypothetical protein COCNU_scaffold016608G000010 [Cocos nucifera]|nr:hypothetical protein [Cocos nucifera]